jgi:predicted O-methyltransferase YrrM
MLSTFILILYLNKGYGQFDIMFQDFSSEKQCEHAANVIKSMKQDGIITACIQK